MKRFVLCLESTSQSAVSPKRSDARVEKKTSPAACVFFNLFFRGLGRHETQMKVMIVWKLQILSSKFDSEKVKNPFLPIKINQVGSESKDHDLTKWRARRCPQILEKRSTNQRWQQWEVSESKSNLLFCCIFFQFGKQPSVFIIGYFLGIKSWMYEKHHQKWCRKSFLSSKEGHVLFKPTRVGIFHWLIMGRKYWWTLLLFRKLVPPCYIPHPALSIETSVWEVSTDSFQALVVL